MSTPKRDYDSTVARIAGNIAATAALRWSDSGLPNAEQSAAAWCVKLARLIVAETRRTEPTPEDAK
jgi:hypothetical protein